MGTESHLVSVIMTTYNHSQFIKQAILSVLEQTHKNIELIVINDGSLDDTLEKVNSFKDQRIKVITQENSGPSVAFNHGVEIASSDWIAFMSGDDVCLPHRIETQLTAALQIHAPCVLFSQVDIIDQNSNLIKNSPLSKVFITSVSERKDFLYRLIYKGNFLCAPTAFLHKSLFDKYGYLNPVLLKLQDFDFWLRLIKFVDFKIISTPLLQYRWHGSNLSATSSEHQSLAEIEYKLILKNIFDDIPENLFKETFPIYSMDMKFENIIEKKCIEAFIFLNIKMSFAQMIGLEILYDLMQDPTSNDILRNKYGYSERKILKMLKDTSLFILEEKKESSSLLIDYKNIYPYLSNISKLFKKQKKEEIDFLLNKKNIFGIVYLNIMFIYFIIKSSKKIIKKIIKKTAYYFIPYKFLGIASIESIDSFCKRKPDNKIKLLLKSENFELTLPRVYNEVKEQKTYSVPVPDSWIAYLKDINLIAAFSLYQNNHIIIYEPAAYPHYGYHVSGCRDYIHPLEDNPKKVCLSYAVRKKFVYDSGILLSGRCSRNYYHWLIEYLPKLLEIDSQNDLKNIPLIIDSGMPIQHYQALELLIDSNRKYIFHDNTRVSFFKNLIVPSTSTYMPDRFDLPYWQLAAISKKHLFYIRNKILEQLENTIDKSMKYPEKIYLSRRSINARQMTNTEEIESLFSEKGYTLISMEKLNFVEQVAHIKNAKVIAGPAGASMTNILFCQENSMIISLTSDRNKNYCNFSNLAQLNKADFIHFTGPNIKDRSQFLTEEEFVHSPFTVPIQKLEKFI